MSISPAQFQTPQQLLSSSSKLIGNLPQLGIHISSLLTITIPLKSYPKIPSGKLELLMKIRTQIRQSVCFLLPRSSWQVVTLKFGCNSTADFEKLDLIQKLIKSSWDPPLHFSKNFLLQFKCVHTKHKWHIRQFFSSNYVDQAKHCNWHIITNTYFT